jgi:hypothetical membrane protein|tara:strand:- start:1783 stop:1959 length:177 start_codon:yes stop_codon:yes gene_type:complete
MTQTVANTALWKLPQSPVTSALDMAAMSAMKPGISYLEKAMSDMWQTNNPSSWHLLAL